MVQAVGSLLGTEKLDGYGGQTKGGGGLGGGGLGGGGPVR